MGLWPAWYAATLLPGSKEQNPVPTAPFVLGSVAAGFFALAPYLALREYRDGRAGTVILSQEDLGPVTGLLESKFVAYLLSASALGLTAYGVTANGGNVAASFGEYRELFQNQLFVHVTTIDFMCLWGASYGVMVEDSKRRGMDPSACALFAAVPILGHCAYLIARPPLPGVPKPSYVDVFTKLWNDLWTEN